MKVNLTILILIMLVSLCKSQDVMLFKDGNRVKVEVLKIDGNKISYKYYGESHINVVRKSKVYKIKHQNGREDIFYTPVKRKATIIPVTGLSYSKSTNKTDLSTTIAGVNYVGYFGPWSSSVNWNNTYEHESAAIISITFGLEMEVPLTNKFTINPKLLFHSKGAKFEGDIVFKGDVSWYGEQIFGRVDATKVLFHEYLEMPILIKYHIYEKKYHFISGIYTAYLLSLKSEIEIDLPDKWIYEDTNLDDNLNLEYNNRLDFGVILGAGTDFSIAESWNILLDICYQIGLVNVNKSSHNSPNKSRFTNNSLVPSLGLTYIIRD
jgi:hypothetical protein